LTRRGRDRSTWEYIKVYGPAIILTVVGFIVTYQFVGPAPPKHIVIATGMKEGAYYAYGKAYSEIFAREGVALEVKSTAGSVENIKLLEAEAGAVDIAFLQGGTGTLATSSNLVSLGSLYFEPLWIFYREDTQVDLPPNLRGKRIAVGGEGSGTKVLVMKLLELNGLTSPPTVIVSVGGEKAAKMLLAGEVDAASLVTSHRSSVVQMLLRSKNVRLLSANRAEAYTTRLRFLHRVKLPEGVIDLRNNIPPGDITLLAPAAQLVVREDFHPALIDLVLQAATETHAAGGLFERPGEFPSPQYLDFPLGKEAQRFYKSGPPFLRRHLPFWAATLVDRLKIMLLPFLALLFPLFKLMPPIYRWRMRSRIYHWYSELEAVDSRIQKNHAVEQIDEYLAELDRIEDMASTVSVPLSFSKELYDLRLHIEMLRNELLKIAGRKEGDKELTHE
jgi:TRAP transporter TAXI family solute receptor